MGAGITLVVVGAILAFAVRTDGEVVDIQTVGLILMLAGAAVIGYARREKRTKETETHVEHRYDGAPQPHAVRETTAHEVVSNERRPDDLGQQPPRP
jgi:hypothetical protein